MLFNLSTGQVVAAVIETAESGTKAAKGLMGRKYIPDDYAFIIYKCNGIHTFFMRFNIDVIFLDNNRKVVHICKNLSPWKTTGFIKDSMYVIELKAISEKGKVKKNDLLSW
ncbi:MAG: DUF192 domain-containing protein [Bacillota bacterium]